MAGRFPEHLEPERSSARAADRWSPDGPRTSARFAPTSYAGALLLFVFTAACATAPADQDLLDTAPVVTSTIERAGVRDLRGSYRSALCAALEGQAGRGCEAVLRRVGAEPPAPEQSPMPFEEIGRRYRIGIVPGILAECLPPESRPFAESAARLRAQGLEVVEFAVGGRANVRRNAERLAQQIGALPEGPPLIVVGYSKGLVDTLEMAAARPDLQARLAAVISVAGAAQGSVLAEPYGALYRATVMHLPLKHCEPGDGSELRDLGRDVRAVWWQSHGAGVTVPIYSIVALPDDEQLSPILRATFDDIADVDARNDGQLSWTDAVVAPGALLGYVNADHWGIAMALSRAFPVLAAEFRDDVPRAAMLGAAIQTVVRDLEARAGRQ